MDKFWSVGGCLHSCFGSRMDHPSDKDKKSMQKMEMAYSTDIAAVSHEELPLLVEYFKGTNAETAYLL